MKKLFKILIALGLILMIGTAGASDNGAILTDIIKQNVVAIFLMAGGYFGLRLMEWNVKAPNRGKQRQLKRYHIPKAA